MPQQDLNTEPWALKAFTVIVTSLGENETCQIKITKHKKRKRRKGRQNNTSVTQDTQGEMGLPLDDSATMPLEPQHVFKADSHREVQWSIEN